MHEIDRAGHRTELQPTDRFPSGLAGLDEMDLRVGLDEFKPSLIVLESISSIEHSTSRQGFRQFMVGVASQLREHGRSALMTQTIGVTGDADRDAPLLSTIPDAILLVDYDQAKPRLERSIRVLKMRGSPHVTEKRRLVIQQGGLHIDGAVP